MKKTIKLLTVIMLILGMFFLSACYSDGDEDPKERESSSLKYYANSLRFELESCTGTCLTMEEMLQLVFNYEKVQKKWSNKELDLVSNTKVKVPELQLVPPGKYERTENTRYEITLLDKDENGFNKGLQVSVMDDTSACKVPDNTEDQPPVEDNTGSSTEQTAPVETNNTQNVEQKAGVWKLNKEKTYIKEGDPTSYTSWVYTYIAEELWHMYKAYLPPAEDREASDTTFTVNCSAPPEAIKPGETISFTLDLSMQHSGGMLVTAKSYMLYGTPEDDGKGLKYNGSKFGPAVENQPNTCAVDTMGENINHVVVSHTFDQEGSPGSELGIIFYGCDCITLWIYEWIEG